MLNINIRKYFVITAVTAAGLCGGMLQGMGCLNWFSSAQVMEKFKSPRYQLGGVVLAGMVLYGGYHLLKNFSLRTSSAKKRCIKEGPYKISYTTKNDQYLEMIDDVIYKINIAQKGTGASPEQEIWRIFNREGIRKIDWTTEYDDGYKVLNQFAKHLIMNRLAKGKGVKVILDENNSAYFRGTRVTLSEVMIRLNILLISNDRTQDIQWTKKDARR